MPSHPSFPERLKAGSPVLTAWCGMPDPSVAGMLAHEAFDAVVMDLQHGSIDFAAALQAVPLIAAAGKPSLVRIPVGDFASASRFLDAGVSGVIAPMINTIEDARRFAAFTKFPPVGERSWGAYGALSLTRLEPGAYLQQANDLTVSFAMVETREALAIIDDILAVPGIDGIFIGPSDLSIALSGGKSVNPAGAEVEKALDHALARVRAAGKVAAIYAVSGARAAQLSAKGFHMVSIGSDISMLMAGAHAALAAARG
ncbi:HpcH/HpaI aldolase family protein [Microvirga lotononidis]|uniref:2,4-dihydroxyhept-2-ene-1,7-dioic acid aldolase n=1 Tax=Microvirga lotononidis TaxID=864069 RepID=I4YTH4_9HYPH|nr:aldolase/citrate lyase family protein [Microvirga lotononidis]EIM27266.1 2,4-dihydroxyhept-2-ene-1,7-dioic acid aldolase [Microvirga lotononidis]WQO28562.1 aldolase/citrate lyase family protein [Microvirga lotononidis]